MSYDDFCDLSAFKEGLIYCQRRKCESCGDPNTNKKKICSECKRNERRSYIPQSPTKNILELNEFDMSKIGVDKVILIIGKRNIGKTVLIKDYLYHHRDKFPIGIIMNPTEKINFCYIKHIPARFIHSSFDKSAIGRLIERQKILIKRIKDGELPSTTNIHTFVVYDANLKDWKYDNIIRTLFMDGRDLHITFILSIQDPLRIPPGLLANTDYFFICKEPKKSNLKRLYEYYTSGFFPTLKNFIKILNKCTHKFETMVISNDINKQFFRYRSNLHLKFMMFSLTLWIDNYYMMQCLFR